MKQYIKDRWVAALTSGEYQQGQRRLHGFTGNGETFCCLGVLCDLAFKVGVVKRRRPLNHDSFSYGTDDDWDHFELPLAVQHWAGLSSSIPRVGPTTLAHLNDNGMPFDEIAEIIKERL